MTALKDSLCSVKVGSRFYKSVTLMYVGDAVLKGGCALPSEYRTDGAFWVKSYMLSYNAPYAGE